MGNKIHIVNKNHILPRNLMIHKTSHILREIKNYNNHHQERNRIKKRPQELHKNVTVNYFQNRGKLPNSNDNMWIVLDYLCIFFVMGDDTLLLMKLLMISERLISIFLSS